MRVYDAYRQTGYSPPRVSCEDKELYPNEEEATQVARDYERRVVFSRINAYRCDEHGGWHIGHANKRRRAQRRFLENYLIIIAILAPSGREAHRG